MKPSRVLDRIRNAPDSALKSIYISAGLIGSFILNAVLFPLLKFFGIIKPDSNGLSSLLVLVVSMVACVTLARRYVLRIWGQSFQGLWVATQFPLNDHDPQFVLVRLNARIQRYRITETTFTEIEHPSGSEMRRSRPFLFNFGFVSSPAVEYSMRAMALDEARFLAGLAKSFVPKDSPLVAEGEVIYGENLADGFMIPYELRNDSGALLGALIFDDGADGRKLLRGRDESPFGNAGIFGEETCLLLRLPDFKDFMELVDTDSSTPIID